MTSQERKRKNIITVKLQLSNGIMIMTMIGAEICTVMILPGRNPILRSKNAIKIKRNEVDPRKLKELQLVREN